MVNSLKGVCGKNAPSDFLVDFLIIEYWDLMLLFLKLHFIK